MAPEPEQRPSTRERQERRAERILDVTSDLVQRWGYRKTTLDDIAREAEVAKGTLFLHWRTRDALFVSLLRRERVLLYDGLIGDLSEAEPVTMAEFFTGLVREVLARPLIRGVLIGDEDLLGRLVRQKRRSTTTAGSRREFATYLRKLRDLDLIRADLDLDELHAICTATFVGFVFSALRMTPLSTAGVDLPDEQRCAELCGDALTRLLAPLDHIGTGAGAGEAVDGAGVAGVDAVGIRLAGTAERAFTGATLDFLEGARTIARQGYQASLEDVRGS